MEEQEVMSRRGVLEMEGPTERNSGRWQGPGCGCRSRGGGGVEGKVTGSRMVRWVPMSKDDSRTEEERKAVTR